MKWKLIIYTISIGVLILSTLWFISEPKYETAITALAALGVIATSLSAEDNKDFRYLVEFIKQQNNVIKFWAGTSIGILLAIPLAILLRNLFPIIEVVTLSGMAFQEENGILAVEAEHFSGKVPGSDKAADVTWALRSDIPGYLGEGALQATSNSKTAEPVNTDIKTYGPALFYEMRFKNHGKYYVYVRGFAPNDNTGGVHDSIHVGLAGEPVATNHTDAGYNGIGIGFNSTEFTWVNEYNVAEGNAHFETIIDIPRPGTYVFFIWMREDGVVVDRMILSKEKLPETVMDKAEESQRISSLNQ